MTKTTPKTSNEIKARAKIFVTKTGIIDTRIDKFAAYLKVLYKLDLVKGKLSSYWRDVEFEENRLYNEMVHELYPYLRTVEKSRKPPRRKPKR